uniref:Uncharacterized protein n=1 Tax=Pygocentrus nattereri TaxID=42514 RepID=A0AAR2KUA1_PYGNA
MRSSMDWPFSNRFSISISTLEISNTPPTAAVSTPPENKQPLLPQLSVLPTTYRMALNITTRQAGRGLHTATSCDYWQNRT